jgi:HEAT repeat protein
MPSPAWGPRTSRSSSTRSPTTTCGTAPALKRALKDRDLAVRVAAANALVWRGNRDAAVVAVLAEGLAGRDVTLHGPSLGSLLSLGAAARPAVPALLHLLADPDEGPARVQAAGALGEAGRGVEGVVPALGAALRDGEPEVRTAAAVALGRLGGQDSTVIPTLIPLLADAAGRGNPAAVEALGKFGARGVPPLLEAARNPDPDVRCGALDALFRAGPENRERVLPVLTRALADPEPAVRLTAASAIATLPDGPGKGPAGAVGDVGSLVLPVVREALKERNAGVRVQAIRILDQMATRRAGGTTETQALLLGVARDRDAGVRRAALQGLCDRMGPAPGLELLPVFRKALQDREVAVRWQALQGLQRFGSGAREAVPDLIRLLKGGDASHTYLILNTLAAVGKDDDDAVATLVDVFRNGDDPGLRVQASYCLGQLGPVRGRAALPALEAALRDDNPAVREAAVGVLSEVDTANKHLVPAVVDLLGREDREQRGHRTARQRAIVLVSPIGQPALDTLLEFLRGKDAGRRAGAALAIGCLEMAAARSAPALKEALQDGQPRVRLYAAEALWRVTGDATPALPVLCAALKGEDDRLRRAAAELLDELGPAAREAVPALVAALKDPDEQVRISAVQALGRVGPRARVAVPALIELLQEDPGPRFAVVQTLRALGPDARDAVTHLARLLREAEPRERGPLIAALGSTGTAADAGPALVEAMRSVADSADDVALRDALTNALLRLGPGVTGEVAGLLKDKRVEVCRYALAVLLHFGPQAEDVLPALVAALDDKDDEAGVAAAQAVAMIDPRPECVPPLVRGLKAPDSRLRMRAAGVLWKLGQLGRDAVPALEAAATRDPDAMVRQQAGKALRAIDPDAANRAGVP